MAKEKKQSEISTVRRAKHGGILTVIFAIVSFLWSSPILIVFLNSFKRKAYIFTHPFSPSANSLLEGWDKFVSGIGRAMCGWLNYSNGIRKTNLWGCFGNSLFITVGSVALIILCCSMTAWYITRVHTKVTKAIYVMCLFSPVGIIIVYLGFGAGLAVFMFTGFVKSISLEIEEAAMIDGCSPLQTFFKVVFPILKPTTVTVAILEAMWVWNDYLLPSLVLNINKYKTIPIAVQFLKQSHGQIDWGAMMAVLVLAILPIILFYIACQKYIIEGVLAGAVKG